MSHEATALLHRDPALADFADISRIGVGRRATVYRAREIATGRLVALKVLDVAEPSPLAIEAFDREAAVLAALGSHPNIVTLYRRLRLDSGKPVLVLELCEGSTADRHIRHLLDTRQLVSLGIKVAGALETAHRGGVLHRNVTPHNILLTAYGEPTLTDFGIAVLRSATRGSAPLFEFTTVHTAPELLEGREANETTDVYGLASTLYALLAGAPAFRTYERESPAALSLRILCDPIPPINAATVPLALSDVLLWAMAKDPADRPPSAAWLATELARIAANQGWPRTKLLIREPRDQVSTQRHRATA